MSKNRFRRSLALFTLLLVLVVSVTQVSFAGTILEEARGKNGMVAAASPEAAQAGLDMLKAGGNAVDAAVAAAFAIGVVEPNASGLGGEGYVVIYLPEPDRAIAIDYRSSAPAASVEPHADGPMPGTGWKSFATPGLVAGLAMALEKYGTMNLAEVMAPAIRLAEEGFAIGEGLAQQINDSYEKILGDPALSAVFLDDMLPPETGYVLKNPDLAKSLRLIAEQGPDVFYKGELAQKIVDAVQAGGGYLSMEDMAAYRAIPRWPARGSYRGHDLISAPPPVGGATVIGALQIMESFDLPSLGHLSAQSIHLTAESIKRSYLDNRTYISDPDFDFVPLYDMLSKDYARERAQEINPDVMTLRKDLVPGQFGAEKVAATGTEGMYESASTTHISVMDKDRNMVALTQTISSFWGAGVMVPGTGIIANNEMANFSRSSAPVNGLEAGKRMKTQIAPTLVLKDGAPFLSIGTPGAGRIVPTVIILISAIVDYNLTLQEAIEAPRFYARDNTDNLEHEDRIDPGVLAELEAKGYPFVEHPSFDLFFGGAQGVLVDFETGELVGGADPRRDGAAIGY